MTTAEPILTVADLVSTASLGVAVLAGEGGLEREVLWAHSCEMESPERWLGPHELLMTVGLCVPKDASGQIEFIENLDGAGLAGLVIGDHETAPDISDAMLQEADRRSFPVLLAAAETPYAVVARHVAAAATSSQLLQVLKLSKLYQIAANADDDTATLVESLASLLSVRIRILDELSGMIIVATSADSSVERQLRKFPLHGHNRAELQLEEFPGEMLDSFILVHLMKVLEVHVDRLIDAADHRARVSARALRNLLRGGNTPEAESLLGDHWPSSGFHIAAFELEEGARLARQAAIHRMPILLGPGRTDYHALVPHELVQSLRKMTEAAHVRAGLSSLFTDYRDVSSAAEEASRVLSASQFGDRLWVEFEGTTISVLTRSRQEAVEIISGVLGPLASLTPTASKLRTTLFAYLRNDRHWQRTADELSIHRQTLSYRLNRIEEETGLCVTRSADLSALWVAYQAWETTEREQNQTAAELV